MKNYLIKSSIILNKLSLLLMKNGKKKFVHKKVIKSLQMFYEKRKVFKNICILTLIFHRIKPLLETRKVRKGSKYYDVPFYMKKNRSLLLLLRWIVRSVRKHSVKGLSKKLQMEMRDLIKGSGFTYKEYKLLRLRVASNVIYSHYRWK
jgi:ribosomal protein S7